jgi:hypothetical protein
VGTAVWKQCKILEHDAQIPSEFVDVFAVRFGQVVPANFADATGEGQVAVKASKQGALARSCLSDEVNQFARLHSQVDRLQHHVLLLGDASVFDANQR